jgi:hypothetical protein
VGKPGNVRNLADRRSCAIVGCGQAEWMEVSLTENTAQ